MNIRIQPKAAIGSRQMPGMTNHKFLGALFSVPFRRGNRQMPRINSHCKIRAAAFFVSGIDSRIQTPLKFGAHRHHQMPACRKPKHSYLVRINVVLRCVKAHQPQRPLRIFQRHR